MAGTRRPRADAVRNRQRVLETAEQVFATEGVAAGLLEIADRAGVGAGTVHRHFPTKESLVGAVIGSRLDALLDRADALPHHQDALFSFWDMTIEETALNVAMCEALSGAGVQLEVDERIQDRFLRTLTLLVDRARDAGLIRTGLTAADVSALLSAAVVAASRGREGTPGRLSALIRDGLRPT